MMSLRNDDLPPHSGYTTNRFTFRTTSSRFMQFFWEGYCVIQFATDTVWIGVFSGLESCTGHELLVMKARGEKTEESAHFG